MANREISLSTIKDTLAEIKTRFGNKPLDTHMFVSKSGMDVLKTIFPPSPHPETTTVKISNWQSVLGFEIWHDPTVLENEIELGRVEVKDGAPRKIVTKILTIGDLKK